MVATLDARTRPDIRTRRRLIAAVLVAGFWIIASAPAVSGEMTIPESAEARDRLFAGIADPVLLRAKPERAVLEQSDGSYVMFRTEEQNGNYYYLFLHETDDTFPLVSPGAYVIRRNQSDGAFSQVKIFLQNHPGSFARITPAGRRSSMDLFLAGTQLYQNVPVPLAFSRVLRAPFARIQRATAAIVDWNLFAVEDDPSYREVERVVAAIRQRLPDLPDGEDGALNETGVLAFIETERPQGVERGLNCSGFAKWIVDGYFEPAHGELLPIGELKTKHLDARGTQWSARAEDSRDPYFGLDWTRNLAIALNTGTLPNDMLAPAEVERFDVRHVPFSSYREDIGYPVDDLGAILYWLAKYEPGNVYLGSVSTAFGSAPVLRQHTHVAVFYPYFDGDGIFRAVVFERNVETSLASLSERYPTDFVHLVRLERPGPFEAPLIPGTR